MSWGVHSVHLLNHVINLEKCVLRPCHRTHGDPELTAHKCEACRLHLEDPEWRLKWGPPSPMKFTRKELIKARLEKVPCIHRGEPLGEQRRCEECGKSHKMIDVHGCDVHGQCSVDGRVKGAKHCLRCNEYSPALGSNGRERSSASSKNGKGEGSEDVPRELIWSYGVTTIPDRRRDLLPRTLGSLRASGFDRPTLFVDGCSPSLVHSWEKEFNLEVSIRWPKVRSFGSWVLALWELYLRKPLAQRYAIFQDDFVCVRNLRSYLERAHYPERCYLNLYTFPENQSKAPDEGKTFGFYKSNQKGKGAVALVFSNEAVRVLLSSRHMADRPMDHARGWKAIDGGIVTGMNKQGWSEFVHNPSLVQHTGTVSSMGNKRHPLAPSFPGEEFDALSLLPVLR